MRWHTQTFCPRDGTRPRRRNLRNPTTFDGFSRLPSGKLFFVAMILIVDDDRFAREFLREEVAALGHGVELAKDGAEGWETFQRHDFDLVITDIRMPRLDGPGLVERIRATGSDVAILVETGDLGDEGVERARHAGADRVMDYTALIRDLPTALDHALAGQE